MKGGWYPGGGMSDAQMVYVAELDSCIGRLRLASTESGLAYLELPRASGQGLSGFLHRQLSGAVLEEGFAPNQKAAQQILEFLDGKRQRFELSLDLRGTAFQLEVWNALRAIPYGETRSYAALARAVDRPNAVRAVGAANGANPVSLVVPCHRVINSNGKLGGYAGGLRLKARLLDMEQGQAGGPGRLL